ncbi:proline/glycine betaine ABC transporter ATP-binding protein ProV [Nitrincola tibetensis]|uniref:Quaternary amine transport ATP-binding protein n=1 Tax=Nitrincola tibetensis TaxID=2219697 RepID=A0A364NKD8_9GAMM|nr:glycine betaine/L-proline ABC transporter ATP-binding protein ProV [Nitrincola tibetensis]RAU17460.1 proline/glycine betaine ABC transporter ATP-binding protein ProV [Nitrincola tibetensis]
MSTKLEVKNLYKVFGDEPKKAIEMAKQGIDKDQIFAETGMTLGVKDVSLQIHTGEIFVIMGLSGSGKSTLVRLLNRLIEPSAGQVLLDGENIAAMSDEALRQVRLKKISMVFQSFALMPHLSVLENTAFGLELAGVPVSERHEKAMQALQQVGLESHLHAYPDELSGGMQQRVGLARALAIDPEVLLMDEAFSALDPLIRTGMQDELVQLQAKYQRTIVFISHDLDEAMRIGDRIAIMQGGEVVQVGTPDDILHNPANDYVRSFFQGVNVSQVFTAKDICRRKQSTIIRKTLEGGVAAAIAQLQDADRDFGYVVDKEGRFEGVVSLASLWSAEKSGKSLMNACLLDLPIVKADSSLSEIISVIAQAPCAVPVVDDNQKYLGLITRAQLLQALDREEDTTP